MIVERRSEEDIPLEFGVSFGYDRGRYMSPILRTQSSSSCVQATQTLDA